MKSIIRYFLLVIIFLIVLTQIAPKACNGCGSGCKSKKSEPTLVQQSFTLQCLDSAGNILSSTHLTTDWAGGICDYYRIVPDKNNTVRVKFPGYYVGNSWHNGNEVVLTNSDDQDLTLPETGQSQPMPTRGPGEIQIISAKIQQ